MSNEKSVETEEPVRFEITTSTNQYKVMTNSFMTSRMRSLMASIPSKYPFFSLTFHFMKENLFVGDDLTLLDMIPSHYHLLAIFFL